MAVEMQSLEQQEAGGHHRKDVHQSSSYGMSEADLNRVSSFEDKEQKLGKEGQWQNADSSKHLTTGDKGQFSVEELFAGTPVPPWWEQITVRSIVVSVILGGFFCIITHKLSLTVGVIPSLNVSAGLLGYFFIRTWIAITSKLGFSSKPFTRQENTVIQTCVVACYGLAFSGGFGSYLLGLDPKTYNRIGADYPGNHAEDVKKLSLGWIIAFLFTVSFLGVLVLVPLRKIMILKYKLTYPSGTATAVLINSFHTPQGAEIAKKQVRSLGKSFTISFLWSFFKWFYSGKGDATCGFDSFPSLGLKALDNRFNFDFSLVYVGAGMICPHIVNCSVLLGAIISWGFMWPLIQNREGEWYPHKLGGTNFRGLYGYKVFVAIALILGDGLYNFVKVFYVSAKSFYIQYKNNQLLPMSNDIQGIEVLSIDEKKRNEEFLKDRIPLWVAVASYIVLAGISIGVVPQIFKPLKWYYVLICYIVAPVLAFCNAYGCGLTDWSLASTYGKLGLFIFSAWAGSHGHGVVAGLAACGVMMVIVASAADLMQDFKTGYLTRSSPRSMFTSQLIGIGIGCILAPVTFWMFWKAFDVGNPDGEYKAPYAVIYRQMTLIGVQGFSALPRHCLQLCYGFFSFAIITNLIRDLTPRRISQYIPIPMAMAIPFYIGAYFAIDMFIGTVIVFVWQKLNKRKSEIFVPAVASGFICGDGVWSVPSAILALVKVNPPICMMFVGSKIAGALQNSLP
ncbi:hypothetical protein O6H91_03G003800 [Diphasiastrum complanatum]|uniref:Uncharacterized protein n=2 Tax=Diphasiastrum complanatum TaxID=34168 RepID=A0ACC2E330_DIPCM|nr:hypothetical protein O6H91_03G003800 [Diphasiastrum complanatum]